MRASKIREFNVVRKDARKVEVLFGYAYPSTYRTGMTSLATHLFYSILNDRKDTSCERYFRYDVPSPCHSMESSRPLKDNQVVGFSLTYEEDIVNLIQMLELGGIPALAADRSESDPIVLVGGPVPSSNPEPYVDFVDAFAIGEGDIVIHKIIDSVAGTDSRTAALEQLAQTDGLYVPRAMPSEVRRLIISDLDALFHPTAQIVPEVAEGDKLEPVFGKSLLVEATRGCGHSCKFCLVGHVCRPWRTRSLNRLEEIITKGLAETPVHKVSLISSSLGSSEGFEELAAWIVDQGYQLSVPSLRADSVSKGFLSSLAKGEQRTLTIAPETGSPELRRSTGKALSDEDIEHTVKLAAESGFNALKLYFIIGLPGESEQDVAAIPMLVSRLGKLASMRITVSVNPFVPKAQTKWEREAQAPIEVIRSRVRIIEKGLHGVPHAYVEPLDPRNARIQAALSIGDRSLGKAILIAARHPGYGGWRKAQRDSGIPLLSMANEQRGQQGDLPWAFIKS
ncbi:MAG: hypothetical protein C4K47_01165 [Candidatus Thorarchaeota archaeon]|nr:MAG: hypothetical protein C4K47_01165 [Candidatus Thorarchaeota archaeon]